jgi:hypothetical protein
MIMSAKSAILFSAPEDRSIRRALVSKAENGAIFKDLPGRNLSLSVRRLCLSTDVPILYKWMRHQYAGPLLNKELPPGELEESYACMIESDFAQPFMCLVNETPVCQINVYKTLQDVISLYYDARPGDYGLQLVVAPGVNQESVAAIMSACLEYFFSFPEVERIIADIETTNEWSNTLYKMAGFHYCKKIKVPYKPSNLYIHSRDGNL